jgi:serine/threonine protein kinase
MILGQGSYGEVKVRNGQAVKKFSKLSHLIQEYLALKYLDDCEYVVHSTGVNFASLELNMELYDCSLRKWLEDNRANGPIDHDIIMKILKDILLGLIECHDRQLAHGDLKPGNILVMNRPFKIVLGDCGFVSIAKYAKVDRTAAIYRDPIVSHDSTHDMFSFGICFLEMIAEIKINRQATYVELKHIIKERVVDPEHRKIIYNLLHEDKDRRPSARAVLYRMFRLNPSKWIQPKVELSDSTYDDNHKHMVETRHLVENAHAISTINKNTRIVSSVLTEDRKYIRCLMKATAYKFNINRGKKGYGALLSYIDSHKIDPVYHRLYTATTLMILSSIFGKSGFREQEVVELCDHDYDLNSIFKVLKDMLSDHVFISILLAP